MAVFVFICHTNSLVCGLLFLIIVVMILVSILSLLKCRNVDQDENNTANVYAEVKDPTSFQATSSVSQFHGPPSRGLDQTIPSNIQMKENSSYAFIQEHHVYAQIDSC